MWFQTSSQLFFNIHCISLPFKKQDKNPYPTVFSPPWFVKGTDPSFCFSSTFQPEFWAWGKPLLSMTPVSNPIPTNLEWDFFLLPFYRQSWSLLLSSLHLRTEIRLMDVLPRGNLFKPSLTLWDVLHQPVLTFQGWDSKSKPHNRKLNYYTSTDLIHWKNNSSWKFSSRVLFLFILAFTGIYLLKINFFNRTLNESN